MREKERAAALPTNAQKIFRRNLRSNVFQVPGFPAADRVHAAGHKSATALQFVFQAHQTVAHPECPADLQQGAELTHWPRQTHRTCHLLDSSALSLTGA